MKKTTIWISPEGVPMYQPNGWPDKTKFGWLENAGFDCDERGWAIEGGEDAFYDTLAKAKKEAITFEDPDFLWNHFKRRSLGTDRFIEIEGEIESIQQMQGYDGKWVNCNGNMHNISWNTPLRQIARLKPAEAVSDPGVGKYYNSAHGYSEGADAPLSAQQINHECQKHNDELVKQLEEANTRFDHAYAAVATSFGRTLKKSQEERDEALKRVKELEDLIKSDVVNALLRFAYKSPSSSGCDNFEGSENIDLYNISNELRKK